VPDKVVPYSKPKTLNLQQALDLAVEHHQAGDLPKAENIYRKILQANPNHSQALHLLGVIAHQRGENEKSIEFITQALTINPEFAEAHNNLGNAFKALGCQDKAFASYKKALNLKSNYADAHNNLGLVLKEQGELEEAVASYQTALRLKPGFTGAYNNLGGVYIQLGKVGEAISCLQKAISLQPDSPGVQHRLDSLLGNTTDCAPRKYVEEVFNSYANKFDDHLVNKLQYKIPTLLREALRDLGSAKKKYRNVIDLGCGTGLSGLEFRDIAETLVGIDLSENMISKAETKNIYDELYVDDIIPRLKILNTKFDFFISCDVFVYIGDLYPLFSCVREHSTQNSVFVFSTEHTDEKDFVLRDTARYAHSKDYVLSVASKLGFECEVFKQCDLRHEKNNWIVGGIYVLNCM